MSDELDLDAIEARYREAAIVDSYKVDHRAGAAIADIPALLTEVKRYRAATPEWEYSAIVPDLGGDPLGWGPRSLAEHVRDNPEMYAYVTKGLPVVILRRTKGIPAGPWLPVPTHDNEGVKR